MKKIQYLLLWLQVKKKFKDLSFKEQILIFATSITEWHEWKYRPVKIKEQWPPVDQTFLAYYPSVGWLFDRWPINYVPDPLDMPTHWISINVLPVPSDI